MRNCVIFGDAQADRSPCGTDTSAKFAALYATGELKLHEPFVYESITGVTFRGEAVQEVEIAGKRGIIPQINDCEKQVQQDMCAAGKRDTGTGYRYLLTERGEMT